MRSLLTSLAVIALLSCAQAPSGDRALNGGAGLGPLQPPAGGAFAQGAGTAGTGGLPAAAAGAGGAIAPPAGVSGGAGVIAAGNGGVGGVAAADAGMGGVLGTAGAAAAAGSAGAAGAGAAGAGSGQPTVSVSFATLTYRGQYSPLNYGAIWFESGSGTFVKTVKRWAGALHAADLATWTEASGGWGSLFFPANMEDQVDAMSSATLRMHQMHTVTWNMKDRMGQVVPDGDYVAVVEMSEDRAVARRGPVIRMPFTKGPAPQSASATDQEGFMGALLEYTP